MPWAPQASICYYYSPQREGEREILQRTGGGSSTGEVRHQCKHLKTPKEREGKIYGILWKIDFILSSVWWWSARWKRTIKPEISRLVSNPIRLQHWTAPCSCHQITLDYYPEKWCPPVSRHANFLYPHNFAFQNAQRLFKYGLLQLVEHSSCIKCK